MGNLMSFLKSRDRCYLPEDVVLAEILPKLPVKSLMRFKCVSKSWLDHISNNTRFKEDHHRHQLKTAGCSSIILAKHMFETEHQMVLLRGDDRNPEANKLEMLYLLSKRDGLREEIDIHGSSNGLVLLSKPTMIPRTNLILWNPATREFRYLPKPIISLYRVDFKRLNYQFSILDLVFDETNKDHKVLRILGTSIKNDEGVDLTSLNLHVFSKRADSWGKVKTISGYKLAKLERGVPLNGSLYFLVQQVTSNARQKLVILSFRYRDEKVRNPIDLPSYYSDQEFRGHELNMIRWKEDTLALFSFSDDGDNEFDIWVMVNENDRFCWSKLFRFSYLYPIYGVWRDQSLIIKKYRGWRVELCCGT